jgi:lysophospholipase L1-like esterase
MDLLSVAGRAVPGIARVHAQVRPFAAAWLAANAEAQRGEGPLWVALGDSMSQGIGARDISGGWVGQLHARLTAEGHRIRLVNLSVTGARVRDVVDQQLPQLHALGRPALITVLAGANDMFPRGRRAAAVGQFAALLDQLPAGRSVIAALPRRNAHALSINALIDSAATRGKVRIADLRPMTVRSLIGTRAEDHFHPNERGYARITEAFGQAIDRAPLA